MPGIVGAVRDDLVKAVADEVLGLGPIECLVNDKTVSEIMVNAPETVFYEREGRIYLSPIRFRDANHVMRVVERIVAPLGRRVDESSPMVDARLPDGSRVNVIIPPVAPKSPTVTIRKFQQDKLTIEDLIATGTITREMAEFCRACVQVKLNMLVSGGTGTGKTTLLNALSAFIPDTERIVTIEDPTEVKLQQGHVVSLEARPASLEGKGQVTQRDLVRNALRMRPDRIIVGEVRGPEAFDMMQAMNTGHEGSLSTVHANSPRDCLARIENMVLMAGLDLPMRAIREQMASAIHMVIQISRLSDGSRRVTHLSEVSGMEGQVVTMQELFRYEQEGVDSEGRVVGHFRSTGIRPRFHDRFEVAGLSLPSDIYNGARI
jgi:pilus assembly protein CpaF